MKKQLTLSREVADNIFSIKLPLPGKKPGPVNVYLFIGKDNITLLDAGTSHTFRILKNALAEHGLNFKNIDRIVLTHSHVDHFGAVRKIRRTAKRAIEIAGNFEKPVSIATGLNVSFKTLTAFLALMGVPFIIRSAIRIFSSTFFLLGESCEVTRLLNGEDMVSMGDYQCLVIETPGHTIDSICFYIESENILFSGDHILSHITPNAFVMLEEGHPLPTRMSQKEFYDSIEKIRTLSPSVVCPAHGKPITDLDQVIQRYKKNFQEREEHIFSILRSGEKCVYKIARTLFPDLETIRLFLEIFLAVSEVYTHIQILEQKGMVRTQRSNGVLIVEVE